MARNGKLIAVVGFWLGLSIQTFAQTIWADVTLNKSSVYVGEPVSVSVKVYTSTWFTTGLDLGNIKVQDAFSVYFRPVSTSFQRDGKNYAGVELIYNVFPYETGDVTFPVLDIEVESPAPGGYKGIKHTVKTKEKTIKVKPAPASFASGEWLVAGGLSVSDHWNVAPKQVKVGDVLQRQISRTAYGTVSELIPPIAWDSLPGVSEYPSRSAVSNNKDKTSISASRTETMRYLFEKEGEVTIPEMVFTWYNPAHEKLYKRTLKAVTIQVEPNPDLGVLATVRDSLAQEQAEALAETAEAGPKKILGMSPRRFTALLLAGIIVLIFLFRALRRLYVRGKVKRAAYRVSEPYFFNQFKKALRSGDPAQISSKLYSWIDSMQLEEPSVGYFLRKFGAKSAPKAKMGFSTISLGEWEKARQSYLDREARQETSWINP
ncbi:BatD family protein [Algoriphagus terrigena]|uniref:BatD family protein n=1 Tax=Algoriphagus terrigena TaxID=344884 RepID=UPI0003F805A4|nr:BatD family protein [Algoriphagus terrigena]